MSKLNTQDVINEVSKRMGCYKKDTKELLQHFCDVIVEAVENNKIVHFKPLGTFYPVTTCRGRGAGDNVKICFRPARALAKKINTAWNSNNEKEC